MRKQILLGIIVVLSSYVCAPVLLSQSSVAKHPRQNINSGSLDRKYWCDLLYKISFPVVHSLAKGELKSTMPLEQGPDYNLRQFAMDYYNSFVIYPMMADILGTLVEKGMVDQEKYGLVTKRMIRYAEWQERLISPEGTYPPIGRSLTYRIGAFQALGQVVLMHKLPDYISPAQVRCAISKVLQNQFEMPGTFDKNGWLRLGFTGDQFMIADRYTSTGSLYLCTVGFLELGLPADDKFWTDPAADWTSKKAWGGKPFKKDYRVDY